MRSCLEAFLQAGPDQGSRIPAASRALASDEGVPRPLSQTEGPQLGGQDLRLQPWRGPAQAVERVPGCRRYGLWQPVEKQEAPAERAAAWERPEGNPQAGPVLEGCMEKIM